METQDAHEHILVVGKVCHRLDILDMGVHSSNGCADLDVPSTKSKCQNPQDSATSEPHYKEVCTATEQYKVVWYYSIVHTNIGMCQLSTYSLVLGIPKLLQVCTTM